MKKVVKRNNRQSHRFYLTSSAGSGPSDPPTLEETREERRERRRKERREKKCRELQPTFILFLVLTVIFTSVVAVLMSPICNIQEVEITGLDSLTEAKVLTDAGEPVGQNVFRYPAGQAARGLRMNPYVEDVQITRKPFNGLLIAIEERRPVGILVDADVYLRFSSDGMLMDSSDTLQATNLPIMTGLSLTSIPAPGGYIEDPAFHEALRIVNAAPPDLLPLLQEINIAQSNYILAYTSQGIEVRIGNSVSIVERMYMLRDVLEQIILTNALEDPVEYIDIRFIGAPSIKLKGYDAPVAPPEEILEDENSEELEENEGIEGEIGA